MSFESVLNQHYKGARPEPEFVAQTISTLGKHGFTGANTIACMSICRDELCTGLESEVRQQWGEAFNMSSLAGVPFCGVTAFGAAHAHSPVDKGRERYLYFDMVHIGIGENGEAGKCIRPGRDAPSSACGALCAILGELQDGPLSTAMDPDDIEQSHLRQRLAARLGEAKPDLFELTEHARLDALAIFEHMIERTVNTKTADYALLSGVQVHGTDKTLVWFGSGYTVVNGERTALSF